MIFEGNKKRLISSNFAFYVEWVGLSVIFFARIVIELNILRDILPRQIGVVVPFLSAESRHIDGRGFDNRIV